jgi:ATP-binding cassette subfamily F protein uup
MPPELLLSCEDLTKGWGGAPLFSGISFGISAGEHVGLIGPNGSGKTTFLRLLAGLDQPDRGTRALRRGVRIGYVPQDPSFPPDQSALEVVDQALAADGLGEDERPGRWKTALGRAGFADPAVPVASLSGGWKKRLAIAREVARRPDLLLLDEPTNHLDVEGILWLEELIAGERAAFVAVSHDRWFLENVAARLVELNRVFPGGTFAAPGPYHEFLARRDELLANEEEYRVSLANRVRREIEWLARGAKARTTKSQARIQSAGRLKSELESAGARAATREVGLALGGETRQARRLLVAEGVVKSRGGRRVIDGVDLVLGPGMRLGVLGPNGAGKSTLLALLDGTLAPDAGRIERLAGLRTVHFEQDRASLDRDATLRKALAPEGDSVLYNGQPVHVISWARRFLFRPDQLELRVRALSGGEQARVLLARMMLEPASLLLLDEPTNDLDIPTLEVLEESLVEFPGAIVLVTHDRYLLERVATTILALDGSGRAERFADYAQWEAARKTTAALTSTAATAPRSASAAAAATATPPARRLTWLETREWEGIEAQVEAADHAVEAARAALEDPAVAADPVALAERWQQLEAARADAERRWARWAELQSKRG